MPTLEIHLDQSPDFDLAAILDTLDEPSARRLQWYLVDFVPGLLVGPDGTRNTDPPDWVPSLWRAVDGGEPAEMDWDKLRRFARFVGQTDLALLIGVEPGKALPSEPIDLNDGTLAIVVQALDGYLWVITTQDASVIEAIQTHFPKAKSVERTQRYY